MTNSSSNYLDQLTRYYFSSRYSNQCCFSLKNNFSLNYMS